MNCQSLILDFRFRQFGVNFKRSQAPILPCNRKRCVGAGTLPLHCPLRGGQLGAIARCRTHSAIGKVAIVPGQRYSSYFGLCQRGGRRRPIPACNLRSSWRARLFEQMAATCARLSTTIRIQRHGIKCSCCGPFKLAKRLLTVRDRTQTFGKANSRSNLTRERQSRSSR